MNIPLLLFVLVPSLLVLAVLGWQTWVWLRSRRPKPRPPARDWGRLSMGPPINNIPRRREDPGPAVLKLLETGRTSYNAPAAPNMPRDGQGRIPGKPIGPFGIDYNGMPLAMRGNLKTRDEIINERTAAAHKEATTSDGTPLAPIRETPMELGTRVHKEIEQGFARIGRLEVIEAIEKLTPEQVDKLVEAGALNRNQVAAVRAEYTQRAKYNLSALTDKVLGKDYRAAYADLDSAPETLAPQTTYTDTENTLELERAIGFPRTLTQHEIAERQAGYTGLRNSRLRDAVKPASFVLQPEQRVPLEVTPEKAAEIKKLWLDSWPETKAYFEHMQQLSVSGEIDTEAGTRSKVEVSRERVRRVLKAAHENAPNYGGPRVMIGVDPGVPSSGVVIVDHDGKLVDPSTVSVKHGDITREMIERATPEQLLAGSSLSNSFSTGKRLDKNPGSAHITIENLAETAKEMRAKGEELRATDREIARMRYRLKMLKLDQRFGGRGKWPEVVQFDREELWRETRDPHAHHGIMMPVFRPVSEGVHQHPVWTGSLSDSRTREYAMRYPSKMLRLEAPRHTSS